MIVGWDNRDEMVPVARAAEKEIPILFFFSVRHLKGWLNLIDSPPQAHKSVFYRLMALKSKRRKLVVRMKGKLPLSPNIIFFDYTVRMVGHLGAAQTGNTNVLFTVDIFISRKFILDKFPVNELRQAIVGRVDDLDMNDSSIGIQFLSDGESCEPAVNLDCSTHKAQSFKISKRLQNSILLWA